MANDFKSINHIYSKKQIETLNFDIKKQFPHIAEIKTNFSRSFSHISRLAFLDRYSQKDINQISLKKNDFVIITVKEHRRFPSRGLGYVLKEDSKANSLYIKLEKDYWHLIGDDEKTLSDYQDGCVWRPKNSVEKPLELFWEQLAIRVGTSLAQQEKNNEAKNSWQKKFVDEITNLRIVPAGRILYGAGSRKQVTYFNCFVLPLMNDSRQGISRHRALAMEIMAHGGGVGTNGSTLRPLNTTAKTVGGKSSGSVSWLNDISLLTHLVEQGGSRRGAQMIILADWHPDIVRFILAKMERVELLLEIEKTFLDENGLFYQPEIAAEAKKKLIYKFRDADEQAFFDKLKDYFDSTSGKEDNSQKELSSYVDEKISSQGTWNVASDYLTGANISIAISDDFMMAVHNDEFWELKFPDIDNMTTEEKNYYDSEWEKIGDIRVWEQLGKKTKIYGKYRARCLWRLIVTCATYSAEPGVFFIDRANSLTNAQGYGQKVIATNPCGEQPLTPFAVCNLSAINLSQFVNKKTGEILYNQLKETVKVCVRMQDNVIDSTPYFLEENEKQAKGERRIGMGIMGLHDLLIWAKIQYGSKKSIKTIDKIMQTMCNQAYQTSINLAKEKGSFSFLADRTRFICSGFVKNLSENIKADILKYGIRNSHLLTVAPTGATGTLIGVSTGIEPYFSFVYYRSGRLGEKIRVESEIVKEFNHYFPDMSEKEKKNIFKGSMDLTPDEHVLVQIAIQKWVDSAISKTVNCPANTKVSDVEKIYQKLYKNNAKGGTVYVDGSRTSQVLSITSDDDANLIMAGNNLESNDEYGGLTGEVKISEQKTDLVSDNEEIYGIEEGQTCPHCRQGIVKKIGGCNTCINCGIQLKCEK